MTTFWMKHSLHLVAISLYLTKDQSKVQQTIMMETVKNRLFYMFLRLQCQAKHRTT